MIDKDLPDLISRQGLVDELNAIADEAQAAALVPGVEAVMPIADVLHLIHAQPRHIGYQLLKHGKWERIAPKGEFLFDYCSECSFTTGIGGYRYCPSCGAKMDMNGE